MATATRALATSFNNMANIYEAQGNYEEALELHVKSLDIKTRIFDGEPPGRGGHVRRRAWRGPIQRYG